MYVQQIIRVVKVGCIILIALLILACIQKYEDFKSVSNKLTSNVIDLENDEHAKYMDTDVRDKYMWKYYCTAN